MATTYDHDAVLTHEGVTALAELVSRCDEGAVRLTWSRVAGKLDVGCHVQAGDRPAMSKASTITGAIVSSAVAVLPATDRPPPDDSEPVASDFPETEDDEGEWR
jgi:hypothetical protein